MIFLVAIAGQVYAKEQETRHTASVEQSTDDQLLNELADKLTHSMDDTMVDKLASKLVTKMVDRALDVEPEFHADLDETTLAKDGTPNVPKTKAGKAKAPAPRKAPPRQQNSDGVPQWLSNLGGNPAGIAGGLGGTPLVQQTFRGKGWKTPGLPEESFGFPQQAVRPGTFPKAKVGRLPIAR